MAAVGGGGLPAYALRRLLLAIPVLFGVSVLVFAVLHLAPPLISTRAELEEMCAKTEAVLADASAKFYEG